MGKRDKNAHLLDRNGIWWLSRRLPGTKKHLRRSLKTRDISIARKRRDEILGKWENETQKINTVRDVAAMRKTYLSTFDDTERSLLEDKIIDQSEELATELGVWEIVKSASQDDELRGDAQEPIDYWKTATGRLTPFAELTPHWLKTIQTPATRNDYRRAMDVLMQSFTVVEELDWDKCKIFLRNLGSEQDVSSATVQKWKSAYINFWECFDKDPSIWRNHKLPKTNPILKRPWTNEETKQLYARLRQDGNWLQHPVWIAAHTGARLGAICNLVYSEDKQTILFPRQKRETKDRIIPAHPAIREHLMAWQENPKRRSSVGNRFTEFKQKRGFGVETDFHSFRRTLITNLENLGCPESVTADIVGHKKKTITYGLYSGGSSLELMRDWLFQVRY